MHSSRVSWAASRMSWIDAGLALGIAGGLGLAIGMPPAIAARRLSIVRALIREVS